MTDLADLAIHVAGLTFIVAVLSWLILATVIGMAQVEAEYRQYRKEARQRREVAHLCAIYDLDSARERRRGDAA